MCLIGHIERDRQPLKVSPMRALKGSHDPTPQGDHQAWYGVLPCSDLRSCESVFLLADSHSTLRRRASGQAATPGASSRRSALKSTHIQYAAPYAAGERQGNGFEELIIRLEATHLSHGAASCFARTVSSDSPRARIV